MIRKPPYLWTAAILLWVGVFAATGVIPQRRLSLDAPLNAVVPSVLNGYVGTDVEISQEEQRAAGFTDYLFRSYTAPRAEGAEDDSASQPPLFT